MRSFLEPFCVFVVVVLAVLAIAAALGANLASAAEPRPGKPAGKPADPKTQAYVFVQDGCAPCRKMEFDIGKTLVAPDWRISVPGDDADEQLAAHVVIVNVTDNQKAAREHRIRSTPTTIIFRDGEVKWRRSGQIPAKDLAAKWLEIDAAKSK